MRSSYLIWCCRKEKSWEPPEMAPLREPFTSPRNNARPNVDTSINLVHTDLELCRPTPVQRETKLPEPMDDFDELIADAENFNLEPSLDGPSLTALAATTPYVSCPQLAHPGYTQRCLPTPTIPMAWRGLKPPPTFERTPRASGVITLIKTPWAFVGGGSLE